MAWTEDGWGADGHEGKLSKIGGEMKTCANCSKPAIGEVKVVGTGSPTHGFCSKTCLDYLKRALRGKSINVVLFDAKKPKKLPKSLIGKAGIKKFIKDNKVTVFDFLEAKGLKKETRRTGFSDVEETYKGKNGIIVTVFRER